MALPQVPSNSVVAESSLYTKTILTIIAALLAVLALQNTTAPVSVQAQSNGRNLYVEPGLTTMRNPDGPSEVQGKLMIDLSSGEVWGFPMVLTSSNRTPVSKPVYLGQYDLSAMNRVR